jgi:hypothetical protein
MDWFSSWEKSCKVGIVMFVGAAMTKTGRKTKNFETIFTEEREGGRMEGDSPVYQKKHVKFYMFLIHLS